MAYNVDHLPSRFPIGTKFVIEARPGGRGKSQTFNRFIEFPDGTKLRLPERPVAQKSAPAGRRGRIKRARSH